MLFHRWAELPSSLTAITRALVGMHIQGKTALAEFLLPKGVALTKSGPVATPATQDLWKRANTSELILSGKMNH